jgi:hypothetical protein
MRRDKRGGSEVIRRTPGRSETGRRELERLLLIDVCA